MARKRSKVKASKVIKSLIANDMNQSAAAKELGVTQPAIHKHITSNPLVQDGLQKFIEKIESAGATEEEAGKVLAESMRAEYVVTANFEGEITDERTYADYQTRLKAVDMYLKIKRLVGDKPMPVLNPHLHIHLGDKNTREILGEIADQLAALGVRKLDLPAGDSQAVR